MTNENLITLLKSLGALFSKEAPVQKNIEESIEFITLQQNTLNALQQQLSESEWRDAEAVKSAQYWNEKFERVSEQLSDERQAREQAEAQAAVMREALEYYAGYASIHRNVDESVREVQVTEKAQGYKFIIERNFTANPDVAIECLAKLGAAGAELLAELESLRREVKELRR